MASHTRSVSRPLFVLGACVLQAAILTFTTHLFIADAPVYAEQIAQHIESFSCGFYEPGHLLWRPLGFALAVATRSISGGGDLYPTALGALTHLSIFFSLLCVGFGAAWLYGITPTLGGALFGLFFLVLGNAFVNFSQVGASYVPALAFLILGMFLLAEAHGRQRRGLLMAALAGLAFTASVFLWGPFLLALPAGVLSAAFLKGWSKRALTQATVAAGASAAWAVMILTWVMWELRLGSMQEFALWAGSASHGIDLVGGLPRAVMGFARSQVYMGNVGTLVKQYLLGNPMAPVGLKDLFTGELALFALFYLFMALCIAASAYRAQGRRYLALLALASAPVGYFAISWQGGDLERYLPLLPALVLVVGAAYSNMEGKAWARLIMVTCLVLFAAANGRAMLNSQVERHRAETEARLRGALSPNEPTVLVVATHQDEIWQASWNYPNLLAPYPGSTVMYLLLPGTSQVEGWRESFAERVLRAWRAGKEIRISGRLLAPHPQPGWGWTEGEDPRLAWEDVAAFIGSFDAEAPASPASDGFFTLPESQTNRARIVALAEPEATSLEDRIRACSLPPRRAERIRARLPLRPSTGS